MIAVSDKSKQKSEMKFNTKHKSECYVESLR